MKIYTSFGRQKTLRKFLRKFFSSQPYDYNLNVETYNNEECTSIQCLKNKYRSFDDVLDCANTYYKNITPKCLIHTLLTLNIDSKVGKACYLHMGDCSTINRIRMVYYPDMGESFNRAFISRKYDSKYSWSELLLMLNIKNITELTEYVNKHKRS